MSMQHQLQDVGALEGLLAGLSSVAADAAQQLSADATEKAGGIEMTTE